MADLKKHATAAAHVKFVQARSFQQPLNKVFKPIVMTAERVRKRRELRFALFTAIKTSINSIDPLSEIIDDEFGPNVIKLHRTKCTYLIKNILGPYFKRELMKDLQASPCFSLLVDESTDISITKILAFSLRYYSPRFKQIKETFLALEDMIHSDANELIQSSE